MCLHSQFCKLSLRWDNVRVLFLFFCLLFSQVNRGSQLSVPNMLLQLVFCQSFRLWINIIEFLISDLRYDMSAIEKCFYFLFKWQKSTVDSEYIQRGWFRTASREYKVTEHVECNPNFWTGKVLVLFQFTAIICYKPGKEYNLEIGIVQQYIG